MEGRAPMYVSLQQQSEPIATHAYQFLTYHKKSRFTLRLLNVQRSSAVPWQNVG